MGHVRKRETAAGQPRWQARYVDPSGAERGETFGSRKAAREFLVYIESAIARGDWVDPSAGKITVREWVMRWQATTVANRDSTRARDASVIRSQILPRFGEVAIIGLDYLAVTAWVAEMRRDGLAAETVHKYVQVLGKILESAVKAKVIRHNPCADVDLPRVEQTEMRFLTPEELHLLADCHPERLHVLPLVMGYGGLRVGEALGLRPSDIDVWHGTVTVVEQATEVRGRLLYRPPKTRAARRTVPLPKLVVDALDEHLRRYRTPWLFTGPEGGGLRPGAYRRRVWRTGNEKKPGAVEKAGLEPPRLRRHDLRHTAVALWISANVEPKRIAKWAGHTSVRTVLDRYGHLYPDDDAAYIERVSALADEAQRKASQHGQVRRLR